MKNYIRKSLQLIVLFSLLIASQSVAVFAANTNVTGGTYGASCNSGGYFTPSSITVTSGDTITISVPANDPYAGGVQVHGFTQGSFIVPRGGSVTTNALSANVSYYGTWPNTGCMKGTGSVTFNAPAPPPPSGGTGNGSTTTPSSPAPTIPASTTHTTVSTAPKTAAPTATTTAQTTQPTQQSAPTTTMTNATGSQSGLTSTQQSTIPNATTTSAQPKSMSFRKTAAIGGGLSFIMLAAVFFIWRLWLRKKGNTMLRYSNSDISASPSRPNSNVDTSPPTGTHA